MLKAKIESDIPIIKGVISPTSHLKGMIFKNTNSLKGVVQNAMPSIKGTITDDVKREAYYEVSNTYGTTIIIGD